MKKLNWKKVFGLLLLSITVISVPVCLTSCDDPATFFDKYGTNNNNNNNNNDNDNTEEDVGGGTGPIIPPSPY